ncbi:MAG: DMT family transporter [Candidatus Promineifilaceae bacterium]|nr:DMT family transporter [Candidatus Promineifilaceae bacterium]
MKKHTVAIVAVLLVVDSLHFVFARLLLPYLPPVTSSFYYMTLATLQIALYAAVRRKIDWQVFRDHTRFFLTIGLLIATATTLSFAAVIYIDPGTASLIARMNTIFALVLGIFWLKERLLPGERIGAVLAVIGVFVISFQWGGGSNSVWLGTLLVLGSTFSYALHAAIVKKNGGDIDFLNFFLFRMIASSSFLLLFTLGLGEMMWPTGREVWLILLLAATVNVTISRSLYYLVLRRFKLTIMTIILTLTPVVTILWSMVLFDERPSAQGLIGGTLVIAGVMLVTWSKRQKSAVPLAAEDSHTHK